jgi:5-amino-6-(5-phosphoribosylamino)uracil reductase
LAAQGVQRVLVEGGGDLLAQLLAQDLVDEVNVTLCPLLLGGVKAPTLLDGPGFSVDDARRLQLIDLRRAGDELFLRYAVIRRKTA